MSSMDLIDAISVWFRSSGVFATGALLVTCLDLCLDLCLVLNSDQTLTIHKWCLNGYVGVISHSYSG
jgi:hypothetical protein